MSCTNVSRPHFLTPLDDSCCGALHPPPDVLCLISAPAKFARFLASSAIAPSAWAISLAETSPVSISYNSFSIFSVPAFGRTVPAYFGANLSSTLSIFPCSKPKMRSRRFSKLPYGAKSEWSKSAIAALFQFSSPLAVRYSRRFCAILLRTRIVANACRFFTALFSFVRFFSAFAAARSDIASL